MENQVKLRIELLPEYKGKGLTRVRSQDTRIFINDVEQHNIAQLSFHLPNHGVLTANIEFYPTEIEVDTEVLAALTIPHISNAEKPDAPDNPND